MSVARVAAGGGELPYWAALAAAAWQAEQADRALLRSLILTGGAAATTTAELWKMAGVISDEAGGGIRQAGRKIWPVWQKAGNIPPGSYGSWGKPLRDGCRRWGTMPGRWKKPLKGLQQIR